MPETSLIFGDLVREIARKTMKIDKGKEQIEKILAHHYDDIIQLYQNRLLSSQLNELLF